MEGRKAKVKAADGGHVDVELTGPSGFNTPFVQFQGVVTSPTSLREESRIDFGSNFGEATAPGSLAVNVLTFPQSPAAMQTHSSQEWPTA